mmetsp:Transcript_48462/g.128217  ORF Transcript_48462/g.128217 Transcript_48462/m.128217 type:complete len:241 (-) Transcript_48462:280-1002(-)
MSGRARKRWRWPSMSLVRGIDTSPSFCAQNLWTAGGGGSFVHRTMKGKHSADGVHKRSSQCALKVVHHISTSNGHWFCIRIDFQCHTNLSLPGKGGNHSLTGRDPRRRRAACRRARTDWRTPPPRPPCLRPLQVPSPHPIPHMAILPTPPRRRRSNRQAFLSDAVDAKRCRIRLQWNRGYQTTTPSGSRAVRTPATGPTPGPGTDQPWRTSPTKAATPSPHASEPQTGPRRERRAGLSGS